MGFSKEGTLAVDKEKRDSNKDGKDIQRTPILIPGLRNIKMLAAGSNHILALDHNGNAFTWGCGEQNQLGRLVDHRYRAHALTPCRLGLPKVSIESIACGSYHSFAIDKSGQVYAWGLNNFGQTGVLNGAGEDDAVTEVPTVVQSLRLYKIRNIQGGNHHSIACTYDHKLLVWGRCDYSQAGIPMDKLSKNSLVCDAQNRPRILSVPAIVPGKLYSCIPAVTKTQQLIII